MRIMDAPVPGFVCSGDSNSGLTLLGQALYPLSRVPDPLVYFSFLLFCRFSATRAE